MTAGRLSRMRWAVRGVLALTVAVSVTANILHARPHPVAQAIAAWPPVALLLTVEIISRVPVRRGWLAVARLGAASAIAGIAAYVSYGHMAAVAARYGETGPAGWLLPLSVDGLIVVASISLVEITAYLRHQDNDDSAPASTTVPHGQTTAPDAGTTRPAARRAVPAPLAVQPTTPRPRSDHSGQQKGTL